jgi:hypothetical protein
MTPTGGYGKVPDPPGAAPRQVILAPRVKYPGSKTTKIRYGPYKVSVHSGAELADSHIYRFLVSTQSRGWVREGH